MAICSIYSTRSTFIVLPYRIFYDRPVILAVAAAFYVPTPLFTPLLKRTNVARNRQIGGSLINPDLI